MSADAPAAPRGPVLERIPDGDDRPRLTCGDCGFVHYVNPRIVIGVVPRWQDRILLARRAINPRKGYWTIPAGFLEVGETLQGGAVRETWEEAQARVELEDLIGIYNIARIGQVYMVFNGRMLSGAHAAGPESVETALFAWDEIPWGELAFPAVSWSLHHHRDRGSKTGMAPSYEPPAMHWERA